MKSTYRTLFASAIFCAGLASASGANAALVPVLGGQAINDTDLNVTWAANANLAATNTFGLTYGVNYGNDSYGYPSIIYSDGRMTWGGAQKWIDAMNAANYLGYSDWRLPKVSPINGNAFNYNISQNGSTDRGYNISEQGTVYAGSTGSELAYFFHNSLDNKSMCNPATSTSNSCLGQSGYGLVDDPANPNDESLFSNLQQSNYWSGTEYAPSPNSAWYFGFFYGLQNYNGKNSTSTYALALRSGQAATVPVPAAAWLLGSGLLGLMGVARRKAA